MIDQPTPHPTAISVFAQKAAGVLFQKIRAGQGKHGPVGRDWTEIEIGVRVQQAIDEAESSTKGNE